MSLRSLLFNPEKADRQLLSAGPPDSAGLTAKSFVIPSSSPTEDSVFREGASSFWTSESTRLRVSWRDFAKLATSLTRRGSSALLAGVSGFFGRGGVHEGHDIVSTLLSPTWMRTRFSTLHIHVGAVVITSNALVLILSSHGSGTVSSRLCWA